MPNPALHTPGPTPLTTVKEGCVKIGAWEWTVWPTAPLPTVEWILAQGQARGPGWVHAFWQQREDAIAREQHDPLSYGWEQPPLKVVRQLLAGTYQPGAFGTRAVAVDWRQDKPANDIAILGGNGSGKTEVQAKLAMEVLTAQDHREARCFSQNEQTSTRYIQRAMFKYLPPALRRIKRQGQTTKISYSEATGFSEGVFILPTHSTGLFPTYKAWMQDRTSVEGGECHVLTWDEEMPGECLETVRYRAHKTGGFVLGGFTPVGGYTETVGQYIEGATILETIPLRAVKWDWWQRTWHWGEWLQDATRKYVKGCPPGHVPFVVQSGVGSGRRFAIIFPTHFNPYTNVQSIVESTQGKPVDHVLERIWGWPTRLARKAFPSFGDMHIVKRERVPPFSSLTIWHWADPHGNRNWFMAWVGVDREGRRWIFKEWPSADIGEWALPGSKPDGKPGPAQTAQSGKNFNEYKRLIATQEGWRPNGEGIWQPGENAFTVFDRYLDPRPAGTSVPSDEEALTYLDHLAAPIVANGQTVLRGLEISAGPACGIEEGIQLINDWVTEGWNPNEPVTPLNCPSTYVSEDCPNIIWALRTYTGADGEKGACKDPIDVLKGLAKVGIRHLPAGTLGSFGKSFGY